MSITAILTLAYLLPVEYNFLTMYSLILNESRYLNHFNRKQQPRAFISSVGWTIECPIYVSSKKFSVFQNLHTGFVGKPVTFLLWGTKRLKRKAELCLYYERFVLYLYSPPFLVPYKATIFPFSTSCLLFP